MAASAANASGAPDAPALNLRLSVPSDGDLRAVAGELAAKIVEFLGADPGGIAATLEALTSRVASPGEDITFEFRHAGRELVILARCTSRSSEVRHPLPA